MSIESVQESVLAYRIIEPHDGLDDAAEDRSPESSLWLCPDDPASHVEDDAAPRGGVNRRMRIAILEHDPHHAGLTCEALSSGGYVCHHFQLGNSLLRALKRETFDLIVLDHAVPDVPGFEVLTRIRSSICHRVPVIFLSAYKRESDETSSLNAGADAFMTKPIPASLLRARVRSVLRRVYRLDNEKEVYGEFNFNLSSSSIVKNGVPVSLTHREFELTHLLFQNMGITLSREHILDLIWKVTPIAGSRTVDIHISRIRKKLGLTPESGYRLASIHGRGYRIDRV
jgi:DNA-binding response OmpR family regulator